MQQTEKQKHRCLECGAEFDSREQLDAHQRREHRESRPGSSNPEQDRSRDQERDQQKRM